MSTSQHVGIWLKKQNGYYYRVRADDLPVRDELQDTNSNPSRLIYIVRDVDDEDERSMDLQMVHPVTPVRLLF